MLNAGLTVIVTRPAEQAGAAVAQLQAQGFAARALPLLAIANVQAEACSAEAWRAWLLQVSRVEGVGGVAVFVSPNAVARSGVAEWATHWPPQALLAGPGPGTAQALMDAGFAAANIVAPEAPPYDGAHLWQCLQQRVPAQRWPGLPVRLLRGHGGREELRDALTRAGASVEAIACYARSAPHWSSAERATAQAAWQAPKQHIWLLSSSEAVAHLPALLGTPAPLAPLRALATHPRIAQAARALGVGEVRLCDPTLAATVGVLQQMAAIG